MRTQPEVTLPVRLDATGPVVAQLVDALRRLARDQVLRPGDALPSSRALATHLGIARGSVVAAYEQLAAEGWFDAAAGRSTRVNPRLLDVHPWLGRPPVPAVQEAAPTPDPHRIDLRPGRPLGAGLVGPAWKASWRRAADQELDVAVPALGWLPLREAVVEHLRLRGLLTGPGRVAVTSGGRDGLAQVVQATGARSVGVEDPGYPSLRHVLIRLGVDVVALPADEHGLLTDALPSPAPDLVVVTPSHQYPLGGSLPVDRRQELLAWAHREDVLVIEDDYDSELRYTSAPLPALASMDTDGRVVLLGTFSKVMSPSVATGFLVLPPALVAPVEALRHDLGQPVGLVPQRALADFLASGELQRHLGRMRRLYRRRRSLVLAELSALREARVYPMDGGLHCVVEHGGDERAVIDELARRGVVVAALSDYWAAPDHRSGLVFGFGAVRDDELVDALQVIVEVVGAAS